MYEVIIGLEIHVELMTKSKMFCSCSADYFGKKPNTHTCPVCLGLPGALPVPNKKAIELAQKFGVSISSSLKKDSKFDRKNYFYPDLAKGFQISQYDLPFNQKGQVLLRIDGTTKKIDVTRAHLEEDTGKLSHAKVGGKRVTLIDFNRSGVPLLEIVSEPQMRNSAEAKAYAQKIQQIVRYLEISDADMEKGSMRIEPNVSLRKKGDKNLPNYKVELKNINSFRFAQKAIEFEIKRQSKLLDEGETPKQETRGWNEGKSQTVSQRGKEEAHDYRYFPEPDTPPFSFSDVYLKKLNEDLPELPDEKFERFIKTYDLNKADVTILTSNKQLSEYFDEAIKAGKKADISPKQIANIIINKKPDINKVLPSELIQDIYKASQKTSIDEEELKKIIKDVLEKNQKAVEDYKKGKENALMFLFGQIMRIAGSSADHTQIKNALKKALKS